MHIGLRGTFLFDIFTLHANSTMCMRRVGPGIGQAGLSVLMLCSSLSAALQAKSIPVSRGASAKNVREQRSKRKGGHRKRKLENVMTGLCLHACQYE